MRFLASCFLVLLLAGAGVGASTTTTVDLTQSGLKNTIPYSFTTTSATDKVSFVAGSQAHTVALQGTSDWELVDPTTGNIKYIAAKQEEVLEISGNVTQQVTRQSADGVVTIQVLK